MNTKDHHQIKTFNAWIFAIRPRTLSAAVAPVIVGSALAFADQSFALLPAIAALIVALLLQMGVNLANDYFDYVKGIDTENRVGPLRVTQSGLIPPAQVKAGMIIILSLALLPGMYLLTIAGWLVAPIGAASIFAALAYSGGPYPLASHGLGDLFVFIFFGLIAVCGTYYVQTLHITLKALLMGINVGLLITAILVVNNLRDINTDRQAGKRTLAVTIGVCGTRIEYTLLQTFAFSLPIIIWHCDLASGWVLLPGFTVPIAISLNKKIWKTTGGAILNQALAGTANLALIFSILLATGLILS